MTVFFKQNSQVLLLLQNICNELSSQGETYDKIGAKTKGWSYLDLVIPTLGINGMDLTEAEDIKNRCQEHTEELYKKDLHDTDNHDGVITHTHLEPTILECEVKWALGSITTNKASGGDGIPGEIFEILKDDAVKVLHLVCQKI